ncbi:MAG: phosphopantetheine-binding protein [Clostridia bacterium]|nr:phosphopantetheine-binding protein [Clostridia bacterium]
MIDELLRIIKTVIPGYVYKAQITQKTRIKDDLGIDSLNMMLVAVEIEDEYGIEFDGSQSPDTVGELIDYIQARVAAKENG